jgi:heterodisulfide reductase subunit C
VVPEGVMKATAHWLALKGHTPKSKSTIFDEEFTEQVVATGKIEDGRVIRNFFAKTGQPLMQDWLVEIVKRVARRLPVLQGLKMGWAAVFRPKARNWGRARAALDDYLQEQEAIQRKALNLD